MKILDKVKLSLMIPLDEHYADIELKAHINSCKELLISTGVSDGVIKEEGGLVEALILIYCKTFFGFKSDGSVKELPPSFDFLLRQLVLTKGE